MPYPNEAMSNDQTFHMPFLYLPGLLLRASVPGGGRRKMRCLRPKWCSGVEILARAFLFVGGFDRERPPF